MAGKFIDLNEAAAMLGVSTDELNDMRMRGEINAVRDGSSWKFKAEELERVADERGISLPGADAAADDVLDASDFADEDIDAEPTAIGDADDVGGLLGGEDSGLDLTMGDEAGEDIDPSAKTGVRISDEDEGLGLDLDTDSDLELATADSTSDVSLIPDDSGSEVNLVADSGPDVLGGTDAGLESGELDFEGSDLSLGSDVAVSEDEEIALGGDDEEDLTIGDDSEEISLDDDDELVLESGSDITGGTGDTGINLGSPSDSGLNLEEEPLDLAGSSVSSLELPEDDDLIDLEDLDGGEAVQADEDFQLAPSADQFEDEEDSGSQVIALEDSEAFEEGDGALATEPVLGAAEEGDELETALEVPDAASVTQPALPESAAAGAPDVPYSIWNVLSLLAIILILSVTGMLMTDLVRNMWTWNDPYTASTPVMDTAVKTFGLDP